MSELGLLLRNAREQRGYSLDDIQEATKIRKRYLEAIEQGDYKVLPGSFYVRAFVKTYAETVGLDAEEVLRLYHKDLPKPPAPETATTENIINPKSRSRSVQHNDRWGKLAVTALMWLFPILIIVVLYAYLSQHLGSKAKDSDRGSAITTETASPSASVTPSFSPTPSMSVTPSLPASPPPETVTLTQTKKSGLKTWYDVAPAGAHQLKIVAAKPGWIGVQEKNSSGHYLYNGSPQNSDEMVFDLAGTLYVNIAHPDSTVIKIDDTVVDDGDGSDPVKFYFTPAAAGTETANTQQ